MNNNFRKIAALVALLCICSSLMGCATTRLPKGYKVEGEEYLSFKDLSDEQALKMVVLIYNIKPEAWEDEISRKLTLEEYMALLKKRHSKYVKQSGIFDLKYEKEDLKKWSDKDLIKIYETLEAKTKGYYDVTAGELSDRQNAVRVMHLTAMGVIVKELQKRETTRSALQVAGEVLTIALSVALSFI